MQPMISFSSLGVLSVMLVAGCLLSGCVEKKPALLGVRSTSTSPREVISIEPISGQLSTLGTMGDLGAWTSETALSFDKQYLYAFGTPNGSQDGKNSLYAFDLKLGKVVRSVAADYGQNLALAGVDAHEQLVALRWNGGAEEVILVDPADGAITVLGTMGDLMWWSGETALSHDLRMVYAHGRNSNLSSAAEKLYAFDLESATFAYDIVGDFGMNLALAGANAQDQIIAMRWNGSAEEVIRISCPTGNIEVAGKMGDLTTWTGQTILSDDRSTLYALGGDPELVNGEEKLFTFDLVTDALAREPAGTYFGVTFAGYR